MKTAINNSITRNNVFYNTIIALVNMKSTFINLSQDKKGNNFAVTKFKNQA